MLSQARVRRSTLNAVVMPQYNLSTKDSVAMRCIFRFTLLAVALCCANVDVSAQETHRPKKFVICYNPRVPVQQFAPYQLVVVDYAYPPASVASLRRQGKIVFGYLSIGKVHKQRPFAADVKTLKIRYTQDPQFPESAQVNAADPKWQQLVVQVIVPQIKRIGFNGIFLDDLDDLKTRQLEQHGASLIRQIRQADPELKLMANRGLEYLADFAPHVDYLLLESCFALNGKIRKPADSDWAMGLFNAGKSINPKLRGVALDYIPKPKRSATQVQLQVVARIRELHAENGLSSCVSTEDLQTVPQF